MERKLQTCHDINLQNIYTYTYLVSLHQLLRNHIGISYKFNLRHQYTATVLLKSKEGSMAKHKWSSLFSSLYCKL